MRLSLPLVALMLTSAATAETVPDSAPPQATVRVTPSDSASLSDRPGCRDRVHQVREERGLPRLLRDTATPDEPLLIAAVDHRIDGCSVMVMYGNTSDVRPVPTMPDGPPRLQRIPER